MDEQAVTMITEDQFKRYERVRESGVTNMYDIGMVSTLSRLTREQILEIQENYSALSDRYLKD